MGSFRFDSTGRPIPDGDDVDFNFSSYTNYATEPFRYVFFKTAINSSFLDPTITMSFIKEEITFTFTQG